MQVQFKWHRLFGRSDQPTFWTATISQTMRMKLMLKRMNEQSNESGISCQPILDCSTDTTYMINLHVTKEGGLLQPLRFPPVALKR